MVGDTAGNAVRSQCYAFTALSEEENFIIEKRV